MSLPAKRRKTRPVRVGELIIGGTAPVAVQSMTNTATTDVAATVRQVKQLETAGCELVRVAVPDREAASRLQEIKQQIAIPLVADIHFDHRLALQALDQQVDKIRINPGNIGGKDKTLEIIKSCQKQGTALRIGVNSGSLEKEFLRQYGGPTPEALASSAVAHVKLCEKVGFDQFIVSIKSSDPLVLVEANRLFAGYNQVPLHLGLTEAGSYPAGAIKTAVGLSPLLLAGIGDTLRVSLTGDPVQEIKVAQEILRATGRRQIGPEIISCPTCGRLNYPMEAIEKQIRHALQECDLPITVAIMGCEVNGPGEARLADVGIAGGRESGLLFRRGKVVKKLPAAELVDGLLDEIDKLSAEASK